MGVREFGLIKKKLIFQHHELFHFLLQALKKKEKVKSIIYKRNAIKVAYFIVLGDKRLYF